MKARTLLCAALLAGVAWAQGPAAAPTPDAGEVRDSLEQRREAETLRGDVPDAPYHQGLPHADLMPAGATAPMPRLENNGRPPGPPVPNPLTGPRAPGEGPLPERFRGEAQSSGAASFGDLRWFELFNDDELIQLVRRGLAQSTDLRIAAVRIAATRANLGLTEANQWPSATLTVDGQNQYVSANNPTFVSGFLPRSRNFGEIFLNLLSYEFDLWGRVRNQVEAAEYQLQASETDLMTAQTTVVSQICSNYFTLLEADLELDISRQTLATRLQYLDIVRLRQGGGLATMLDVRQAEQLVQQARVVIPDLQRVQEQTENNLHLLAGELPAPVARRPGRLISLTLPEVPAGLPSALLVRRPDVRSAEALLAAQGKLVDSARASWFPTLSISGIVGLQSGALDSIFNFTGSRYASVIPSVNIPVSPLGKLEDNENLALANQATSVVQYQQTLQRAFNEVSNAIVQHTRAREVRTEQEVLVDVLADRSRLAQLRYEGGLDIQLVTLDAQRDLFNAQLASAQARRNELQAAVQLYKALGGGWQQ